ncbi:osmoprotectant transport system ATP-binding protein [Allocatelliglobosispora scoriae]|uniref:ABC-type quaternary amine transporter n=1 Tax=Allocatelliglobosispora scoriae TaxID=643052 RepID=A0A841C4H1_9ACTN|nr:betaine/proline/choline family ABC transporter ATP-binding protein [Allocatelliglobosispora scoriae]MBB5873721.1 osmoprotectant transport system ATP-binding protein [Allocatelliglobosispora scoriae]
MNATAAATIRLDSVRKQYDDATVAVADLSLEIPAGELVVLIGPSGCGKSTVLRMINRLIEPTSGRMFLGDEEITSVDPVELRRRIGYVIQHVGLFPHQTVRDNVATVPRLVGWSKQRSRERVLELLETVGLDPARYADRYPHELSGGQRQRVGVARALAADPVVLLMDEPFSAVDPIVRGRLQDEFLRLQQTVRKTIVFVTHDVEEAVRLGDKIVVLSEGGKLEQYGTPAEILARPANEFVAAFVGADRGIKRLAVTPIPPDALRPLPADAPAKPPVVAADVTLREALAALLEGETGWVAVERDGTVLGVLTPDDIYAVLAEARAEG